MQETGLYFNHAIVNPPIDRHLPTDKVKDVYIKLEKETDAGIIVSGAKVVCHQLGADSLQHDWLRLGTSNGRKPGLRADVRCANGC
ncbi:4-hydroxyphenylacetate 3-hydroxylase N-terminal domain-containing protein [Escherichia coli]